MARTLICPDCRTRIRVPEKHVGAKIPCPTCERLVAVSGAADAGAEEIRDDKPAGRRPARRPAEPEPDEDAPPPGKGRPFASCPRCGAEGAKRVLWTPWGSFYGPALFNHVRCPACRHAYNGRTGGSNLIPAIVFVTIPLLVLAGLLGFIAVLLYHAMF